MGSLAPKFQFFFWKLFWYNALHFRNMSLQWKTKIQKFKNFTFFGVPGPLISIFLLKIVLILYINSGGKKFREKNRNFQNFLFWGPWPPKFNFFFRIFFGYNAVNFGNMSLQWKKKFKKNLKFLKIAFYFGGPSSPNFVQILFLCKNLKDHLVWNKTANFGWNSLGRSLNHRDTKFSKFVPFSTPGPEPLEQNWNFHLNLL